MKTIAINELSLIAGTQVRTLRDTPTELMYQEVMQEAGTNTMFPPIIVYRDTDGKLWIADGHHRVAATIGAGLTTVTAEVRDGTKADAIKAAVLANRHNGLPLSKADRFHAMEMILATQNCSNPALAELLGVSHQTIMRWREQSTCPNGHVEVRVGKDGRQYKPTQNKKPKSSSVSPTSQPSTNTTKDTTEPEVTQPEQTGVEPENCSIDDLYKQHEALWCEMSEQISPFGVRLQEFRSFYGDNEYFDRIHELFEI